MTAAVVELAVRTLPLPVASRLAGVRQADGPTRPGYGWLELTPRDRARCSLALRVVDGPPFRATCLRRSLLLGHLLRRRAPVLRVGVAKVDGQVTAHAWIEIEGLSLDRTSSDFQALPLAAATSAGRGLRAAA